MTQIWNDPKETNPPSGVSILIKMADGSVHEGHFIKNANKYVRDVNRYRVYKFGKKTFGKEELNGWREMPI